MTTIPTNVSLLYPLKTSENRKFAYIFRGYRSGAMVENEVNTIHRLSGEFSASLILYALLETVTCLLHSVPHSFFIIQGVILKVIHY